jgi:hypothetical protein
MTKEFDEIRWLPCPVEDLDVLEAAYIKAFRPPRNRGKVRKRSALPRGDGDAGPVRGKTQQKPSKNCAAGR